MINLKKFTFFLFSVVPISLWAINDCPAALKITEKGGIGNISAIMHPQYGLVAKKQNKTFQTKGGIQREAMMLNFIHSQNPPDSILKFYEFRKGLFTSTLLSEWVKGKTFFDTYNEVLTPLDFKRKSMEFLNHIQELLKTLQWMHEHGIVHLDIKGYNVMIRPNGELVLIDYGLASRFNEKGLMDKPLGVTAASSSPEYKTLFKSLRSKMKASEKSREPVGPKSDVFSVGIMIKEWVDFQIANSPLTLQTHNALLKMIEALEIPMTTFSAEQRMSTGKALKEIENIKSFIEGTVP